MGACVKGSHVPLTTNPYTSKKRCIWSNVVGTVVQSAGSQKYDVVFDYNGQSNVVSSMLLVVVPPEIEIHIDERGIMVVVSQNTLYLCLLMFTY